jgi:hypothetical protein
MRGSDSKPKTQQNQITAALPHRNTQSLGIAVTAWPSFLLPGFIGKLLLSIE